MFIYKVLYGFPWFTFAIIVPMCALTFVLSLIIGYLLAEPLRLLLNKVRAYRSGVPVSFEPDGRVYEVDELYDALANLVAKLESQQADLIRESRRQNEFVSDVAHELRTPLTAIRGNAELLQDSDLPPEMREKFTSIIINESERLTRLVNDLLTLQRIRNNDTPADELARINLRELAQDVIDTLHPILKERDVQTEIIGEAPDILGNWDRLKEALTNLVENASRFTNENGQITIELSGLRGRSVIQVKDNGAGFGNIDPKLLFDRFYRADVSRARSTGGTGLGLAIVKSIVDAHDGTIEALNRPQGGANFIITIPSI